MQLCLEVTPFVIELPIRGYDAICAAN